MTVFKFHHNGMGTKLGWLRSKNDYRKMVHQSAVSCQTWWECSGHGLAILSRDHSTSMCLPACISVMSKKKKKDANYWTFSLGGSASDSSHTIFLWSPRRTAHEQWCGQKNGQVQDKKACLPTSKERSCVTEWGLWLISLLMFVV